MAYYELKAAPLKDLGDVVLNSINLILGPQGSGKSYLMEQIIKRHRDQFDEVFRVAPARTLSTHPVHSIKEMEEWLTKCDRESQVRQGDARALNQFVSCLRHPDLGIDLPRGLPEVLQRYPQSARDVEKPFKRLLVIDDFGGHQMFRSPNSSFSSIARQLRHMGITAIINCHNVRDVSPSIRSYAGSMSLFGGVTPYDLQEIWKNKPTPFTTWRGFLDEYGRRTEKKSPTDHPSWYMSFIG